MTAPADDPQFAPAALTEPERVELLDWVSACQSAYHIDNTPDHRFGGLGSNLNENRESLVDYVNELLSSRASTDEAPIAWWNGIREADERDMTAPSFADHEDTWHDIPVYAGVNPCRARRAEGSE